MWRDQDSTPVEGSGKGYVLGKDPSVFHEPKHVPTL